MKYMALLSIMFCGKLISVPSGNEESPTPPSHVPPQAIRPVTYASYPRLIRRVPDHHPEIKKNAPCQLSKKNKKKIVNMTQKGDS